MTDTGTMSDEDDASVVVRGSYLPMGRKHHTLRLTGRTFLMVWRWGFVVRVAGRGFRVFPGTDGGDDVTGTSLNEFLLARIGEDERWARECAKVYPGEWELYDRGHHAKVTADEPHFRIVAELDQEQIAVGDVEWLGDALMHVAQWEPARVLAECEAKRRIVAKISDTRWAGYAVRDVILAELALPYSSHPDYPRGVAAVTAPEVELTRCGEEGDGTHFGKMRYKNHVAPICTCDRSGESTRESTASFVDQVEAKLAGVPWPSPDDWARP